MSLAVICKEEDGIEFFTIELTGQSGMSNAGLAKLCGVARQTTDELIQNLSGEKAPKRLKPWIGKDLYLSGNYRKRGGLVKILRSDFCAAVIKHYALEGREVAEYSLDKFLEMGMERWIQGVTGWQQLPLQPEAESINADIVQLADELVSIIFELIWKSADGITNIKAKTIQEQKKLKREFKKGISREFLFSLALEAIGDIGHNSEHQHKEIIKQIRLRVNPYKEYFISKLMEWQEQQTPEQSMLPPVIIVRHPEYNRRIIYDLLEKLEGMTDEERKIFLLEVPGLTRQEKKRGRWSSRLIARYLGLPVKTTTSIVTKRGFIK